MLHLNDVAIARGTHVLYENVTLTASDGERIALIGENGCGKSSLFAAILGELSVEKGDIDAPPQERIAHVAQSVLEVDARALDYVIEGHAPLVAAKAELAAAKASGDAMREAAMMECIMADSAEACQARIDALYETLEGIGIQQYNEYVNTQYQQNLQIVAETAAKQAE